MSIYSDKLAHLQVVFYSDKLAHIQVVINLLYVAVL